MNGRMIETLVAPELAPTRRPRQLLAALIPALMAFGAGLPVGASAQTSAIDDEAAGVELEAIVVTGYRRSLESASTLKRDSTNIVDAVFAEDIGKFPDLNIAEALNRVPGIQLTRQVDGSGLNVAIRGLNTNFTRTTLNGAPIAVASSGRLDSTNGNREVDLDLFPIEFFSQLEVKKSSTASMLEGGVAGTVNIRTSRPFDTPNSQLAFDAQGIYGEHSEKVTPRGSVTGTWKNSDDTFGVLVGISGVDNHIVTRGYETQGWTNPMLTYEQCGAPVPPPTLEGVISYPGTTAPSYSACNPSGGDYWVIGEPIYRGANGQTIPRPGYHVVPSNTSITGNSGTVYGPGTRIDQAMLLDINPGIDNIAQLSDALIPVGSRPHYSEGDRKRAATLVSFEFVPNDLISSHLDVLWATNERDFNRLDMSLAARNSGIIPANMQVDANNVVQSADLYNARFMLQARPYQEELDFYNINPGVTFEFNRDLALDVQLNLSKSEWSREAPTVSVLTNEEGGIAARFLNTGSGGPTITPNVNLNDPNQPTGWSWARASLQNEERETKSNQLRADLRIGDPVDNIRVGLEVQQAERGISSYDLSYSWDREAVALLEREGVELAEFLIPGPEGYITVDYDSLFAATNHAFYNDLARSGAGLVPTSSTAARTGSIDEDIVAAYTEYNHEYYFGERPLRINAGLRYVRTEHEVSSPTNFGFAREIQYVTEKASYNELLPSANVAFELGNGLMLRGALSKTMTRANPTDLLPTLVFVDPSAQYADIGNPRLSPYTSVNLDLGVEWYTDREGYAALNVFQKNIDGFVTQSVATNVPFTEIGIGFDFLSPTQQAAINARGGPESATIGVVQPVNADGDLTIRGLELSWVQPLDNLLDGLGYSVNYTHVKQSSSGTGVPTFATYVSENTANFTTYYENHGFSARLSYVWYDEQLATGLGQNNLPFGQRKVEARGQWDLSASYQFVKLPTAPAVTLNIVNLEGDPQRENFTYGNAPDMIYDPGMTIMLGVRGTLYF